MILLKRRAFTLAELLVVVAIIGLLVAIILPFFTRVVSSQRRVECALHLEKIGQACAARGADRNMGGLFSRGQMAPNGWQHALKSFMSDDVGVFVCPEDGSPAPDPGGGLKGICIECFHRGNFLWDVYLDQADSDQWIWKMSRTQYNEFMKVSGEGKTTTFKGSYQNTGYVEDEDPTTMYFTFEDTAPWGGGDQDFYDVVLEAKYTDSEIQFTVMVRASGMTFALCNKDPDRKVLIPNPRVGDKISVPFFGGKSSYGMNSMSGKILPPRKKLLVMDYGAVGRRRLHLRRGHEPWRTPELLGPETAGTEGPADVRQALRKVQRALRRWKRETHESRCPQPQRPRERPGALGSVGEDPYIPKAAPIRVSDFQILCLCHFCIRYSSLHNPIFSNGIGLKPGNFF